MTNEEAAWLAGILEGEGCFDFNNGNNHQYPRIRIEMRDKDVIERVAVLCGGNGRVRETTRIEKHHNTFKFQVCQKDRVQEVLAAIRPWMSERRGEKIDSMLVS